MQVKSDDSESPTNRYKRVLEELTQIAQGAHPDLNNKKLLKFLCFTFTIQYVQYYTSVHLQ